MFLVRGYSAVSIGAFAATAICLCSAVLSLTDAVVPKTRLLAAESEVLTLTAALQDMEQRVYVLEAEKARADTLNLELQSELEVCSARAVDAV